MGCVCTQEAGSAGVEEAGPGWAVLINSSCSADLGEQWDFRSRSALSGLNTLFLKFYFIFLPGQACNHCEPGWGEQPPACHRQSAADPNFCFFSYTRTGWADGISLWLQGTLSWQLSASSCPYPPQSLLPVNHICWPWLVSRMPPVPLTFALSNFLWCICAFWVVL